MFEALLITSLFVLGYVYFLYPMLLLLTRRLVARLALIPGFGWTRRKKGATSPSQAHYPDVTMIVPCRNEAANIMAKVGNFRKLRYPAGKLKLILVDDASDDGSARLMAGIASKDIRILRNEKRLGKTGSLIKAGQAAESEILVFSDCAAFLNPNAILAITRNFRDESVGLVTGSYCAVPYATTVRSSGEGLYWKYEVGIRTLESQLQSTTHATGALYGIRAKIFRTLEWEHGVINDDLFIPLKVLEMGYNVKSERRARAVEYVTSTVTGEFKRRSRIASGNFQMIPRAWNLFLAGRFFPLFQLVSHKWLRNAGGFLLPLIFVSNAMLLEVHPFYAYLFVAQILFYGLAATGLLSQPGPLLKKAATLPFYFVSTNVASIYGAWRVLTHKGTGVWEKTDITAAEMQHAS